jgi:hypothetical protein
LSAGERRVVVPFAEKLAELVLAIAVRQRRDFGALLALIGSHALLHRASRDRDQTGAIIATDLLDLSARFERMASYYAAQTPGDPWVGQSSNHERDVKTLVTTISICAIPAAAPVFWTVG